MDLHSLFTIIYESIKVLKYQFHIFNVQYKVTVYSTILILRILYEMVHSLSIRKDFEIITENTCKIRIVAFLSIGTL